MFRNIFRPEKGEFLSHNYCFCRRVDCSAFRFLISLSVFIVSDTEDVEVISEDEENVPPSPVRPEMTTSYHTPCTPSSGIMFWGSPANDSVKSHVKVQTTGSKGHRRPLRVQNYHDTPSGEQAHRSYII